MKKIKTKLQVADRFATRRVTNICISKVVENWNQAKYILHIVQICVQIKTNTKLQFAGSDSGRRAPSRSWARSWTGACLFIHTVLDHTTTSSSSSVATTISKYSFLAVIPTPPCYLCESLKNHLLNHHHHFLIPSIDHFQAFCLRNYSTDPHRQKKVR